jgi:hypothetical protein
VVDGGRNDIIDAEPARRRGGWIAIVVFVVGIGVPLIAMTARQDQEPATPEPTRSEPRVSVRREPRPQETLTQTEVRPNMLLPDPRKDGRRAVLDVTFPDGSRARLSYPAALRLAELGVRPAIGVRAGEGLLQRRMQAPLLGEAEISGGEPMLRRLTDNVALWPQRAGQRGSGYVMAFTFGRWTMAVNDGYGRGLSFDQRMALARGIRGKVDRDGYLVLTAREPAQLGRPGEESGNSSLGPQLWFGGGRDPVVVLVPTPDCGPESAPPPVILGRQFTEVDCMGDMLVAAGGDHDYVERVMRELEIRPLPPRRP